VANLLHGSDRTTRDVDLVVYVEYHEMEKVVKSFEAEFRSRIQDPLKFLEDHFVLPLAKYQSET